MPSDHILYSFRRCPYAMRARWALINCNVNFSLREIDLRRKPLEMLKVSSKATVPILITKEGNVIDESLDIILWALNSSKSKARAHQFNPILSPKEQSLINENDINFKYHLDRYKYATRFPEIDSIESRDKARAILKSWNELIKVNQNKNQKGWLTGDKESIADWSLWPFVRQYINSDKDVFADENHLEALRSWLNYYLEHNNFDLLMQKKSTWEP